jgi:hypothetical protein
LKLREACWIILCIILLSRIGHSHMKRILKNHFLNFLLKRTNSLMKHKLIVYSATVATVRLNVIQYKYVNCNNRTAGGQNSLFLTENSVRHKQMFINRGEFKNIRDSP